MRRLRDPLMRWTYRIGYHVLHVYWFVVRPRKRGVKCVITRGGEVLLVRHTYGHHEWDLPGGGVKRREAPSATVRREMREELGIEIEDWRHLGDLFARIDRKRDTLFCFEAAIGAHELRVDPAEIADARWFERDRLPDEPAKYVRRILALSDRVTAR